MRTIDTLTQYITREKIAAKVVDGILDGNFITSYFISNGKSWTGGREYIHNLKYQKSTAQGWYTGMGNFDTSVQANLVQMKWRPSSVYGSVTLPGLELSVNANDPVIRQEAYQMQSAAQDLLDSIGDAIYGSGASNTCDGLDNIVDDATVAATYAGLARSTYAALNADVTSSVGSLALSHMGATCDAATHGSKYPKIIVTTETIWRALEDLLFPSVSATYGAVSGRGYDQVTRNGVMGAGQSLQGMAGYNAIFFRGIPVVKDEKCSSGDIYYLNPEFLYWSGLPHYKHGQINLGGDLLLGVDNPVPRNHGICWTGMKEPINQDGETGQFIMYGQMICTSPRHQAKDEGVTA